MLSYRIDNFLRNTIAASKRNSWATLAVITVVALSAQFLENYYQTTFFSYVLMELYNTGVDTDVFE